MSECNTNSSTEQRGRSRDVGGREGCGGDGGPRSMGDGADQIVSLTEVRDQLELNLRLLRKVEQKQCRGGRRSKPGAADHGRWFRWSSRLAPQRRGDSDVDTLAYALRDTTKALEEVGRAVLQMRKEREGPAIEHAACLAKIWQSRHGWGDAIFWDEGRYAPLVGMIDRLHAEKREAQTENRWLEKQLVAAERGANEAKRELESARGEVAAKDQEIERLRQRLEEAEGAKCKVEEEVACLRRQYQQLRTAIGDDMLEKHGLGSSREPTDVDSEMSHLQQTPAGVAAEGASLKWGVTIKAPLNTNLSPSSTPTATPSPASSIDLDCSTPPESPSHSLSPPRAGRRFAKPTPSHAPSPEEQRGSAVEC